MIRKKMLLSISLMFSLASYAQNNSIDSLKKILKTGKEDTGRVNLLNAISYSYKNKQPDSGLYYGQQALVLSEKLKWKSGIAKSYNCIGTNYYALGEADKALEFLQKALSINKQINDNIEITQNLGSIGAVYQFLADYPKALSFFQEALNLSEQSENKTGIITNLSDIGATCWNLADYQKALENFLRALAICEQTGNKESMARIMGNLGVLYTDLEDYPKALEYCKRSLSIHEQFGNKKSMGIVLGSIGTIYYNTADYSNALEYYKKSLNMYQQAGDKVGIGQCLSNIGGVYLQSSDFLKAYAYNRQSYNVNMETGNKSGMSVDLYNMADIYRKADNSSLYKMGISPEKRVSGVIEKLDSSLKIASEIEALDLQRDALEALSVMYEKRGNTGKAYVTYKKYIVLRDSILNDDKKQEITRKEIQYEYDKKEALLKAEQENKDVLKNIEIEKQKLTRNFSIAGTSFILIFTAFGFSRYKKKKQLQSLQALMKERLRISRELHDEVGSTLSGIAMYSHLTKEQIKRANFTEVEKSVSVMQQSAGEMINKLGDIVWLINPDQDSLQKLVQRLEEYAKDMAAIKNMQVNINKPAQLKEHSLPIETRRNIYLVCKESINNAVKYSDATAAELTIRETNGMLEFTISDNGKGFDPQTVKRGNGLNNMQKRADEIGAKIILQSKQNEGTLVSVQVKIT